MKFFILPTLYVLDNNWNRYRAVNFKTEVISIFEFTK